MIKDPVKLGLVVLCTLLLLIVIYPYLTRDDVIEQLKRILPQKEPEQPSIAIQESNCPSMLGIMYYVDAHKTSILQDDDVFIGIFNPDDNSYKATLIVESQAEGKLTLKPHNTSYLISDKITSWWREGMVEQVLVEEDKEIEQDQTSNKRTFLVEVQVEGCHELIMPISPSATQITKTLPGGGGGSGGSSSSDTAGSSYHALSITKDERVHLED